ncbi:MAG: MFS transporter, partial [Elusimicrobiaceae bacterium]|nr:MFS transporter [Elusimicrobiaceae bacterium]
MNIKLRLTVMNFLEFAVWGAYLTSMGIFLAGAGFADKIGWFYATQGFVSLFMPAVMGIVADRWIPAQKMLGLCHLIAAVFIAGAAWFGAQANINFAALFTCYTLSVAFYMPTLALSNSVAYTALRQQNLDTVKCFPPIRVFGTVGFIIAMWTTNFA